MMTTAEVVACLLAACGMALCVAALVLITYKVVDALGRKRRWWK